MQEKLDSLLGQTVIIFNIGVPSFTVQGVLIKIGNIYCVNDNDKSYCYFEYSDVKFVKIGEEIENSLSDNIELDTYYIEVG